MIRIRYQRGRYCPFFYCDACGQPITDPGTANALIFGDPEEGESAEVFHVHHGVCDCRLQQRFQDRGLWTKLSEHLAHLVWNTGFLNQRTKRNAGRRKYAAVTDWLQRTLAEAHGRAELCLAGPGSEGSDE